jgi:WD40 repeat protein
LLAGAAARATAQLPPDFHWVRGGHGHTVTRIAFSPDGSLFATTSADESTKIWRSSDGQLLRTLLTDGLALNNSVQSLDFSSDGQMLATAGWDNSVRLWNVADGALLRTIKNPSTYFSAVALSPDGQFVCGAGSSATIRMWSVSSGALVASFNGHMDWVNDLDFSPDGLLLASSSSDDTVRVWTVATAAQKWSAVAHDSQAVSVEFAPDGLSVGSAGGVTQPRIKTWNAGTGALIKSYTGMTHQANDVTFSPDGSRIAGSGGDGQVRLWNTATGAPQLTLPIGTPPTAVSCIDFSPDGARLLAAHDLRSVTLWDAVTGNLVREITAHPGWVHALDFTPDGGSLASAAFVIPMLCPVKVFDVATGEQSADLGDVAWGLTDLRYSSDGRYMASSSGSGVTFLIDLTDQSPDYTIPVSGPSDFPWFARFSPDNMVLASGGTEGTIQVWSVTSPPQLVDFIDFGPTSARNAEFTPDGNKLVIAVGSGVVIWDLVTDSETIITFPQAQNVSDIKVSPDGLTFFASHGSGLAQTYWIRQIDLATQAQIRTFVGHTDAIHSIDLTSDGETLVSGAADFTVRLWSVANGTLLRTYAQECGHNTIVGEEGVPRVVFSPDDKLFAYGRNDGTVVMAHNPFGPQWTNLGSGLGGAHGIPLLTGSGLLQGGAPLTFHLSGALESTFAFLGLGLSRIDLPLFGGILVPSPDLVLSTPTNGIGAAAKTLNWPSGLPPGTLLYAHTWLIDPASLLGFAASNALLGTP